MTIQRIHYVQESMFLESGKRVLDCDFYFHSTGDFSLITQNEDGTPVMINGRVSSDKFFEFNNLINREVFYAKMPELFGENVLTPKTKLLEKMSLECLYETKEKIEKTELLYDADPFNNPNPTSSEEVMLLKMVTNMCDFIESLLPSENQI